MAALYCLAMVVYYVLALRRHFRGGMELARLLWVTYFALGCSALLIAVTGVLGPRFGPNYPAILYFLTCVLVSIAGFKHFNAVDIGISTLPLRSQSLIEGLLIVTQFYAIAFFLPFATSSLVGDVKENRLDLSAKMEALGSYGLFNTFAGAASQLFAASISLAFIRLAQPEGRGRNVPRAAMLLTASLSYFIYVLAYVGRDGVVYWTMTAALVFVMFRPLLPRRVKRSVIRFGLIVAMLLSIPFALITAARFIDSDTGILLSLADYFGSQLNNFSDYSSIERPLTLGIVNFPMFAERICRAVGGAGCENWADIKEVVFAQYLVEGKEPWLFGTYISDFVGDFGFVGALIFVVAISFASHRACAGRNARGEIGLARLLMIVFLFLIPYWGVFYFRFSIINGFIIVNVGFIVLVWAVEKFSSRRSTAPNGE